MRRHSTKIQIQRARIFGNDEYEYVAVTEEDEPEPRRWNFYEAFRLVLRKKLHAPLPRNALNMSIFVTAEHEEMKTTKGRLVLFRYDNRKNQMAKSKN
jgi:hypothetical protein